MGDAKEARKGVERRKFIRVPVNCSVIVRSVQGEYAGVIRNIGEEGINLEAPQEMTPNHKFNFEFELPDGPHFKLDGLVCWGMTHGSNYIYGIRFISMGFMNRFKMKNHIKKLIKKKNLEQGSK